jgi:hypothetical protein
VLGAAEDGHVGQADEGDGKSTGDEEEQIDVLEKILERERNRQGLSAPTDG